MIRPRIASAAVFVMLLCVVPAAFAGLQEYVNKPDSSYAYTEDSSMPLGANTAYAIHMTSQTWRGILWTNWLTIIVPAGPIASDKAMLLVAGGSNPGNPERGDSGEARILSQIATQTQSVVAVLKQVPNQPLFNGRKEDGIIAYTFDKYLKGEGEDWPLLFPMVKSAVRAMDTVQEVVKNKTKHEIKQFVVTGASKRGWTTWLTAAVDPRVVAIMPMVIDHLNTEQHMANQLKTYGTYSEQVQDYTNLKIQERMSSPAGKRLNALVDPYSYRDKLTLPKLIFLGTNDPYWTVDSANLYYSDLKGEKFLHYAPNTGHDLGPGSIPTLIAFYATVAKGGKLPEYSWKTQPDGSLQVSWNGNAKPLLWKATSSNRDFRNSQWTSTPLEGNGQCVAKVDKPAEGWVAYFVELQFSGADTLTYSLTTTMTVLPDTYPAHPQAAASAPALP